MNRGVWVRMVVPALILVFFGGGCAAMRQQEAIRVEQLLADAGFRKIPADTPEKLAYLKTMPSLKLVKGSKDGRVVYTYADPAQCQCLYVGGPDQYAEYRHFLAQKNVVREEQFNELMATEEQARALDMWDPL